MKNTNTLLSLTLIISICLLSCQKEFTPEDVVTSPPTTSPTGDSTYLDRFYYIEITGGVADTLGFVQYIYDSNKRVIKLADSSYFPHTDFGAETTTYYYHGNDTIPFKSYTEEIENLNDTSSTTSFFYYNTLGQREADSVIQVAYNVWARTTMSYYSYLANNIHSLRFDSIAIGNSYYLETHKDTAVVDNRGNVISNRQAVFSDMGVNYYNVSSTVTYDDKPSPFARLSNFRTLYLLPTSETFFHEMANKNNRLKISELGTDYNGQPQHAYNEDLTGKYVYRADGYPIEINNPETVNGVTVIYKKAFVYKKF